MGIERKKHSWIDYKKSSSDTHVPANIGSDWGDIDENIIQYVNYD